MNNGWIDVSVMLHNGVVHWPGDLPYERKMTLEIAKGAEANLSEIACSAHIGTHVDAPRHFIEGGATIETMPVTATVGRARVIEVTDPEVISIRELKAHRPGRGERILFKTRNSAQLWNTDEFQKRYVYIAPDVAEYLVGARVQTVGVDYLSVGGFKSGGPETHRILLGAGVWIIEGLNLADIEPGDYELVCLPLKLQGSDGAPARAILRRLPA